VIRCAVLVAGLALAPFAHAAETFAGKTIRIYAGGGPGGTSGFAAQIVAEHFPHFLPGAPQVIPQFMEGAGGTRAIDYVANVAPRDGTAMGLALPT